MSDQLQLEATDSACTGDPRKVCRWTDQDGVTHEACCCDGCTEGREIEARLCREPLVAELERIPWFNSHLPEGALQGPEGGQP